MAEDPKPEVADASEPWSDDKKKKFQSCVPLYSDDSRRITTVG
jgi:hypothetical protein